MGCAPSDPSSCCGCSSLRCEDCPRFQRRATRRYPWLKPLLLFFLTLLSTTWIGGMYSQGGFFSGLWFSIPLMVILTCHEMGHYLQSRRYGVSSTLPYFIPIPLPPFGTLGAFIRMDSRVPHRRALFDIGISGPLAGLVPTIIFMVVGLSLSTVHPIQEIIPPGEDGLQFNEPLIFRFVASFFCDRSVPDTDLLFHPIAMAAWVGLFLTSLNLMPVGQLDGGHVFYALLGSRAKTGSKIIFFSLVAAVVIFQLWQWSLMLILLFWMGTAHPPTARDSIPLDRKRKVLGWLTLAFLLIGFTPNPIQEIHREAPKRKVIYALDFSIEERNTENSPHSPFLQAEDRFGGALSSQFSDR